MSDIETLEIRLRDFAAASEDSDWGDVLRRAERPRRVPRRRTLVPALATGIALVLAGTLFAALFGSGRPTSHVRPEGPNPWTDFGGNPWGEHGKEITLDALRAGSPQIPLPSSSSANGANVGSVWVWGDPASGHVAAAIYYPQAKIELLWAATGLDYTGLPPSQTPTIDGVRAILSNTTGLSVLNLPVGAGHVLELEGYVPQSELIDIAHTLNPSPADDARSENLDAPPNTLSVTYTRTDGALTSIAVTASPNIPSASVAVVDVFGDPGDGRTVLVYQQQVRLTPPSAESAEQRPTWTGTLSPSDWSGGCQAGWRYTVDVLTPAPGTSLADLLAVPPAQMGRDPNREIDGAVLAECVSSGKS